MLRKHDRAIADARAAGQQRASVAALVASRDALCEELAAELRGSASEESSEWESDDAFAAFEREQQQHALAAAALLRRHDRAITDALQQGRDRAHVDRLLARRDSVSVTLAKGGRNDARMARDRRRAQREAKAAEAARRRRTAAERRARDVAIATRAATRQRAHGRAAGQRPARVRAQEGAKEVTESEAFLSIRSR